VDRDGKAGPTTGHEKQRRCLQESQRAPPAAVFCLRKDQDGMPPSRQSERQSTGAPNGNDEPPRPAKPSRAVDGIIE